MGEVFVLLQLTRKDIVRWRIYAQRQLHQLVIDLVVVDGISQIRQTRTQRNRFQSLRELSDLIGIVIFFDMLTRPGNRHTVQQFKEIKIQSAQQCIRRALLLIQLTPRIEGFLRLLEDILKALCRIQPFIQNFRISLIGYGKLILQIHKAVVDRCRGKHQNLCLDPGADYLFHQLLIAVLLRIAVGADSVTEVM